MGRRGLQIAIALSAIGVALAAALLAGSGAPGRRATILPEAGGVAAATGTGQRVTPGEYRSPALAPGARERGELAAEADARRPAFRGEVNGLFLYAEPDGGTGDRAYGRGPCARSDLEWLAARDAGDLLPEPGYLPPGAFEQEGGATACGERVVFTFREFVLRPAGVVVGVARSVGRRAVQVPRASAGRVEAGSVAGRPAAFVHPLTQEGFGASAIVVRDGDDAIRVSALDLPFEELLRIATGAL